MSDGNGRFYGKYRGKVKSNSDAFGRIQVEVPRVLSGLQVLALPCVPFAGPGVGFFALPPVGADVWVEFEGGELDVPIWSGCFWDPKVPPVGIPPAMLKGSGALLKTQKATLKLSDGGEEDDGLTLEVKLAAVATPLTMKLTSSGIEIVNGSNSIKLTAKGVNVNDGALEVI